MKTRALLLLAISLLFANGAQAAPILFKTSLSGLNENPSNSSSGTGLAFVTYDPTAHTLRVEVEFAGLTAPTTVAHIHCCVDPPGNIGVATFPGTFPGFPAGVTSGSYDGTWDLTQTSSYTAGFLAVFGGGTAAGAEAALLAGMLDGRAYVNIHTSAFPAGEIRGFLAPIPEPVTSTLLGIGLVGVMLTRRRRLN